MSKKFLLATLIPLGILLIAFIIIVSVLANANFSALPIDNIIAQWAYDIRGSKDSFMFWFNRIITELGYTYFVIFIILLMGIIWKFKSKTWFFGITILMSWIFQKIIKAIINRPRPDDTMWWMTESSSSFPSGHSITVACVFILLIYFVLTSETVKLWIKYLISALSILAIFFVGFSRIILGVHYFTDVIGGIIFGAIFALLGIIAYNIYLNIKLKNKDKKQNT